MTTTRESNSNHRFIYLLVFLIIALGGFLRVEAIQDTKVIAPIRADARHYVSYALNYLQHGTYSKQRYSPHETPAPDALRPPVYSFFLAGIFWFRPDLPVVMIQYIQTLLSTVTVLLAFLLCRRFMPASWALMPTLLVALSPHLVIANVYVLTETLFTFGLVAALLFCIYAYERNRKLTAFLSGAVLGLLNLTRSAVQYFIVVLAALFAGQGRPARFAMLAVLGFVVVFGAWSARNVIATGAMADDTQVINFLHHGMYPDFEYDGRQETFGFPYRHDPDSASINASTFTVLMEIMHRFRDEPGRHLRWFLLGKPVRFWQWDMIQGMGDVYVYPVESSPYFSRAFFQWTHWLSKLVHAPLVALGLLGSVLCWFLASRLQSPAAAFSVKLVAAMILYYQLLHIVGAPFPRYSVPLRPLIYAMAVYVPYLAVTALWGGDRSGAEQRVGSE